MHERFARPMIDAPGQIRRGCSISAPLSDVMFREDDFATVSRLRLGNPSFWRSALPRFGKKGLKQSGVVVLALAWGALAATAQERPTLSFYGVPGLVDMPSAQAIPDGDLSLTVGWFGNALRNSIAFQFAPRITGVFRYSRLGDANLGGYEDYYDRSFDFRFQLLNEGRRRPAVALGLQDFGGTGLYAAEYLTATKTFGSRVRGTLGIGWGRLGSFGGFDNPLGAIDDRFETRSSNPTLGGTLDFGNWFRGDAAVFGGVEWQATDKLTLAVEYSSDAYDLEQRQGVITHRSPFNFGVNYRLRDGVDLGAYYLYGSEIGARLSFTLNPKSPPSPGGLEGAPPPVHPRPAAGSLGWSRDWVSSEARVTTIREDARKGLDALGLELVALRMTGTAATIHLRNPRYDAEAQAIGRAARALTRVMPPSVETFTIIPVRNGTPMSSITLRRSDLEQLETALDGAAEILDRAKIVDAAGRAIAASERLAGAYPKFEYGLGPYLSPSYFDPDNPVRADFGAQLSAAFSPEPGLVFAGQLRQPIFGNLDQSNRASNSVLPHVRTDVVQYEKQSELELSYLTAEYFFRPGRNLYGRVTAGYLEKMYGGVSGELLWKPVSGPLALGVEVNYVRKRDFDQGFGFQDYGVATGHASAYYEFADGYLARVDAGRYLAGDWGATFSLDREFDNGFRVGAFFTLTDVPFSKFGEGSFDKGIHLTIPLSWLSGEPTRRAFSTTIRPVTRDGGARLNVRNRLYETVRGNHVPDLQDRWGKFWR